MVAEDNIAAANTDNDVPADDDPDVAVDGWDGRDYVSTADSPRIVEREPEQWGTPLDFGFDDFLNETQRATLALKETSALVVENPIRLEAIVGEGDVYDPVTGLVEHTDAETGTVVRRPFTGRFRVVRTPPVEPVGEASAVPRTVE